MFNFLWQSHTMNGSLLVACIFLLAGALQSCNSGQDDTTSTPVQEDTLRDPYWIDQTVGANNTEKKQQVAKKYNSLLVFHADDTMQVNNVYTATLALAKNAILDEIKEKVLDASDANDDNVLVDSTIQLGKRMKAKIIDMSPRHEPSFYIESMGEEEQNLSTSKEAYWNWKIEPLKQGQHKLKLSVQVILSDDDKINLPPRDIMVTIFATKVSFSEKVRDFFSKYWQWIITAILLPIFIAWLTNRIKRSNEPKKV